MFQATDDARDGITLDVSSLQSLPMAPPPRGIYSDGLAARRRDRRRRGSDDPRQNVCLITLNGSDPAPFDMAP